METAAPLDAGRDETARGVQQVGEGLEAQRRREAEVDEGEGSDLGEDGAPGPEAGASDEAGGEGSRPREQERGRDVAHLLAVGVADHALVGPGVHEGGNDPGHEVAHDECADVVQDEGAEQEGGDPVGLLHELEFEEQVRASHTIQRLQVGGVNGQKGVDHAVDLHEGDRLFPLGPEQGGHERWGTAREERHRRGDQERRGLEGTAHQALHAGAVVLHAGDRRQHDRLDGSVQHRPDRLRVLLALRDQAELGGREPLAHDEVGEALVPLLEEPRGEQAPPEAEQLTGAVGAEDHTGPPVHLEREGNTVDDLVGELLRYERPQARARERGADARRGGHRDGGHGRTEYLPHLEVARDLGDLHGVEGVDDQEQPESA